MCMYIVLFQPKVQKVKLVDRVSDGLIRQSNLTTSNYQVIFIITNLIYLYAHLE